MLGYLKSLRFLNLRKMFHCRLENLGVIGRVDNFASIVRTDASNIKKRYKTP